MQPLQLRGVANSPRDSFVHQLTSEPRATEHFEGAGIGVFVVTLELGARQAKQVQRANVVGVMKDGLSWRN